MHTISPCGPSTSSLIKETPVNKQVLKTDKSDLDLNIIMHATSVQGNRKEDCGTEKSASKELLPVSDKSLCQLRDTKQTFLADL